MGSIESLVEKRDKLKAELAEVEHEIWSRHGEEPEPEKAPAAKKATDNRDNRG